MIIDYDAYIQHYGVKGMRWGVRRDRDSKSKSSSDTSVSKADARKKTEEGKKFAEGIAAKDKTIKSLGMTRKELAVSLAFVVAFGAVKRAAIRYVRENY